MFLTVNKFVYLTSEDSWYVWFESSSMGPKGLGFLSNPAHLKTEWEPSLKCSDFSKLG